MPGVPGRKLRSFPALKRGTNAAHFSGALKRSFPRINAGAVPQERLKKAQASERNRARLSCCAALDDVAAEIVDIAVSPAPFALGEFLMAVGTRKGLSVRLPDLPGLETWTGAERLVKAA